MAVKITPSSTSVMQLYKFQLSYHLHSSSSRKPRLQAADVLVAYLQTQILKSQMYQHVRGSNWKTHLQAADVLVAPLQMQLF